MIARFQSSMFNDTVVVTAKRAGGDIRRTFSAYVMPFSFAEPTSETAVQSTVRRCTVLISAVGGLGWIEADLGSRPQIGDRVTLPDGVETSVTRVTPCCGAYYELEVKQCS